MILNVIDKRAHLYRWMKVNAITETTRHDNPLPMPISLHLWYPKGGGRPWPARVSKSARCDQLGKRADLPVTSICIDEGRAQPEAKFLQAQLLDAPGAVVSFHFGLPSAAQAAAPKARGSLLLVTATSLAEARAAKAAGIDAVVAQGRKAGGHRGVFDDDAPDDRLGVMALRRLLVDRCSLPPVIAAGGIMDGRGVSAALALGAQAAQLGTPFVAWAESAADSAYRAALRGDGAFHTIMTAAISGRPARRLGNAFTRWAADIHAASLPDNPRAYDAGKALNAAARAAGEGGSAPSGLGKVRRSGGRWRPNSSKL